MKRIILTLLIAACYFSTQACTTFFINKNGELVFGRNYDWLTGNGIVCTNQQGLFKTSAKTSDGESITWTSKYGSITFNQYGKEFPTGGMNETGLVVELMWLDGTQYPSPDTRPSLGVLQWIQYQLDNCSTVEELIATDDKIRISSARTTPLHYLVADANGMAAAIEFLDGKMVVHTGKQLPFPVLTNTSYASSIEQTTAAAPGAISVANATVSYTDNSIDRFAKACTMVKEFQQTNISTPIVDYSFSILDNVAQPTHTKWSIVYDITNKKIFFKTADFSEIRHFAFKGFNFNCSATPLAWDMNQVGVGDITKVFIPFTMELNRQIVERSFDESSSQFTVSEEGRKETWQYPAGITCPKE